LADEYSIALQATIDDSSLSSLQTEINNLSTKLKPIKLEINTSNVESKIKNIKTQIEALSKIKINLGAGTQKNGFANVSQTTAAYKELLSIANQIDKLTLKAGGMKSSGVAGLDTAKIEEVQDHLRVLYNTYQDLQSRLSQGNLTKSAFKGLKQDVVDTKSQLVSLEAELTSMQSKMVTGIKTNITNGSLGNQVIELENRFKALGVDSQDVINRIATLKNLLSSMDASDDIESVVSDYELFKNILTDTTNRVKNLKREQSTVNTNVNLANARTSLSSNIDVWLQQNSAAAKQFGVQLRDIQVQLKTADATQLKNLNSQFQEVKKQAQLAGVSGKTMGDQFRQSLKTVGNYLSAAMLISRAIGTMRNMYNEVLKVDTAMTGLYRVTNLSSEEYAKMYDNMTESAKKYGSTLSDIIDLTTSWVKLGFDSDVANKLAEVTTTYQHVADLDTNTATKNLITAYKAFQTSLDEVYNGDTAKAVSYISDIFDKLNNEFALSAADVGAAMERSASALREGGNSIQESAGLITGMTEVIQNADKTGTILQTTSLRLRGMKGQLEELGEEVDENVESISKMQTHILNLTHGKVNIFQDNGDFKSTYQILKEIAGVYNQLKDTERADLLETIAGKRNANGVAAVLQNWKQVEAAVKASTDAEGTAAQENEKYMNSMQGKINATKTAWQALANTIMSSDFLKGLIDGGQTFLNIMNGIVKTTGALPPILAVIAGYLSATQNVGRVKKLTLYSRNMPTVVMVLFGYGQFRYYRMLKYNRVNEVKYFLFVISVCKLGYCKLCFNKRGKRYNVTTPLLW